MRFADMLRIALSALYQQKTRTLLTMLGVVLGTFILIVSVSLGRGVQQAVLHEFSRHDQLRKIEVWPGYKPAESEIPAEELAVKGDMSEDKRERLRQTIIRRWNWSHLRRSRAPLNKERIETLGKIEHVRVVVPFAHENCRITYDNKTEEVVSFSGSPDNRQLRNRIVAGDYFSSDDGRSLLVHEYLLYRWGVASDADVESVLGKKVRLEYHTGRRSPFLLLNLLGAGNASVTPDENRVLQKAMKQLPAALTKLNLTPQEGETLKKVLGNLPAAQHAPPESKPIVAEFTIAGVFREFTKDDKIIVWGMEWLSRDADVILPMRTAEELFYQASAGTDRSFETVTVIVDHKENVKEVAGKIHDMGLEQFSLGEIIEQVQMNLVLLTFAMGFVSAVSLLVAALGITNTMVMSVLERTHEIGVMKAVGARDSHIQLIFLVEGALIGVLGGLLGLALSWVASFPGDRVAKSLLEKQAEIKVDTSLFVYPVGVTIGIPVFAALVTTLAAVYPARRAARVNPITALRHE